MSDPGPASFREVFDAELDALFPPEERAMRRQELTGLALSGGGIRSATFNLGVIQALAAHRELARFDYLSTVSGGGYIGSWLSALILRLGQGDVRALEASLASDGDGTKRARFAAAVHFLRRYSNYLTPRVGVLGADMMTAVAIYTRNLMLNLGMIALVFAAFVLVPYPLTAFFSGFALAAGPWSLVLTGVALVVAALLVGLGSRPPPLGAPAWYERADFLPPAIGASLLVAAASGAMALAIVFPVGAIGPLPFVIAGGGGALATVVLAGIAYVAWRSGGQSHPQWAQERRSSRYGGMHEAVLVIGASIVGGALGGLAIIGAGRLFVPVAGTAYGGDPAPFLVVGFCTPLLVLAAIAVMWIQSGLGKRAFTEQDREWHGRLTGYALLAAASWAVAFAVFLGAAELFRWIEHTLGRVGGFASWSIATIVGVLAARSRLTGSRDSPRSLELIARVAPWIFGLGLLIGLALFDHWIVSHATALDTPACAAYVRISLVEVSTCHLEKGLVALWLLAVALALARLIGYFVDINLFSFHQFYRNRLARCYLGASKYATESAIEGLPIPAAAEGRRPHESTGLDPDDDLFFKDLATANGGRAQRPYHIVNAALSLAATKELAWQYRRAASFVFTPLYSGFQLPPQKDRLLNTRGVSGGYRATSDYLFKKDGPRLGMLLAISGAAVSPNAGYHTSPAVTFLLTVFNLRLGRWCGNPATADRWRLPSPRNSLTFLFRELRGATSESSSFVHLSDGGHFENLGLYELVRRRCARIVVCDSSADFGFGFPDLADAIRKVRVDFDVEIVFPPDQSVELLRAGAAERRASTAFVVGRILYPATADDDAREGELFYLKPTLVEGIPEDVANYARRFPGFPHETTVDQWFDEPQFESYRKLGLVQATKLLESERWVRLTP